MKNDLIEKTNDEGKVTSFCLSAFARCRTPSSEISLNPRFNVVSVYEK